MIRGTWRLGVPPALVILLMIVAGSATDAGATISLIASSKSSSGAVLVSGQQITLTTPAGVSAGTICITDLITSGDNIITAPNGWKVIREDINAHYATQSLYWHLTTSTEPSSYTWTTGGDIFFEGAIACYSGVNVTTPIDPGAPKGAGAIGTGMSITAPSITTQTSSDLIIGAFLSGESTWGQGVTINLPATLTARWSFTDADAAYMGGAVGDRTQTTAGATGGLTITTNQGRTGDALIGQQFALQPANPGPPPPPPSTSSITFLGSVPTSGGGNLTSQPTLAMPSSSAVPAGSICVADLSMTGQNVVPPPAGWNLIRIDNISYFSTQGLYWHLTNANEPPAYTWNGTGGVFFEGIISCYYGVNSVAPIDPGAPTGSGVAVTGTAATAPSITTRNTGDLIIGAFAVGETNWGQGVTLNLPATLTQRSGFTDADASYLASKSGDRSQNVAGATGGLTATTANGLSSDAIIAQQAALQPAGSTPTPAPTPTPTPTPTPAGTIAFAGSAQSGSGGSLTSTMLLTMPTPLAAGDICIAHIAVTGPNNLQVPGGWTTIREDLSGYAGTQGLYWHLTGSNEPASYTWSTFSGQAFFEGTVGCYVGVNKTTPIDPGAPNGSGAVAGGTAGVTAPSITTETAGDLIIGAAMAAESSWGQGVTVNLPAALTMRWTVSDASASFLANAAGDRFSANAGASGPLTISTTNGKPGDGLVAQQVALQPGS
jgi:hypothetical protein